MIEEFTFDCIILVGKVRVLTCKNYDSFMLKASIEALRKEYPNMEFEVIRSHKLEVIHLN